MEPDPDITKVVVGDKFSEDGVEVVEDPGAWDRRRLELDRIKAEVDQRCDWHRYYAGLCNCNNKEDNKKEDQEDGDETEEVEIDNGKETEVKDTSSNVTKTGAKNETENERIEDSQVCTVL